MTLFCTAVTGIILLAMTFAGLLAFKNLLEANDAAVHDKDINSDVYKRQVQMQRKQSTLYSRTA